MLDEIRSAPRELNLVEGSLAIWNVRPGLVFTQGKGRFVMAHAEQIMASVEAAARAAPGDAAVVHDWLAVESYEVAVQARMTPWSVTIARSMRRIVIGVRSPLVALAVRTVNLAVGGRFEVLADAARLHAAARDELRRPWAP
ncbi:MAG TPA: hypothetical protein VM686_34235 [Polyangiaceae bacterium]|nr:hypothetical protein [Polyangiaceae bacterium]